MIYVASAAAGFNYFLINKVFENNPAIWETGLFS